MRGNGCCVGVLVLALLVFPAAAPAAEKQGPRIHVREGRFDLGTIDQGTTAEHLFEIRNMGDEVLEIQRVQPS